MSSYLITGASRGLGFQFLQTLAENPENTVIGLVRNKAAAEASLKEQGLQGIHIVEAQYTDLPSLKKAAEAVKEITGGSLDYLIHNAAVVSHLSNFKNIGDFDDDFEAMEKDILESLEINLLGYLKTVRAFLPLIRNGKEKKIIAISTGMADIDLINSTEIPFGAPYAISKGALNIAVAKYSALYKGDGILFMAVSPGYVDTERNMMEPAPEDAQNVGFMVQKFSQYAPHFTRPLTPEESVTAILSVAEKSSIENGDGGAFISHLGNKQWL